MEPKSKQDAFSLFGSLILIFVCYMTYKLLTSGGETGLGGVILLLFIIFGLVVSLILFFLAHRSQKIAVENANVSTEILQAKNSSRIKRTLVIGVLLIISGYIPDMGNSLLVSIKFFTSIFGTPVGAIMIVVAITDMVIGLIKKR